MMNDLPQQSRRGGRKGINWLRARTMYLAGENLTNVARAIGVRRQNVSKRAAAENWRAMRDASEAETGRKFVEQAVDDNVTILRRHDAIGAKLLDAAEKRIDEVLADGGVSLKQLRDASAVAVNACELQRGARAIRNDESMVKRSDDPFVVTLRKSPDLTSFEVLVSAFGGDQDAAQAALRRAQQTEVADTA